MKKIHLLPLLAAIIGCSSNDDSSTTTPESESDVIHISEFHKKNYDNTGEVTSDITYTLEDNRIISLTNNETITADYTYNANNQLATIKTYTNNTLTNEKVFEYNEDGDIETYTVKTPEDNEYLKYVYTYTTDTIFYDLKFSDDDTNYTTQYNYKMVLDANDNVTYHYTSDEYTETFITSLYDENNNMITETHTENSYVNDDSYSWEDNSTINTTIKNPASLIYYETYGKRNLMLLYHYKVSDNYINTINTYMLNPNVLETYTSSFLSDVYFEIENTIGTNTDYVTKYEFYSNLTDPDIDLPMDIVYEFTIEEEQ